jgi:hypothetical protein
VHPLVVRSVLVSTPEAVEYQVRQTPRGIDLAVIAPDGLDERSVAGRLTAALQRAGLAAPNVSVGRVAALDRLPRPARPGASSPARPRAWVHASGRRRHMGAGSELVVCWCTTSSGIAFRADLRRLGRPDGHR